jgi:hypothetical protein
MSDFSIGYKFLADVSNFNTGVASSVGMLKKFQREILLTKNLITNYNRGIKQSFDSLGSSFTQTRRNHLNEARGMLNDFKSVSSQFEKEQHKIHRSMNNSFNNGYGGRGSSMQQLGRNIGYVATPITAVAGWNAMSNYKEMQENRLKMDILFKEDSEKILNEALRYSADTAASFDDISKLFIQMKQRQSASGLSNEGIVKFSESTQSIMNSLSLNSNDVWWIRDTIGEIISQGFVDKRNYKQLETTHQFPINKILGDYLKQDYKTIENMVKSKSISSQTMIDAIVKYGTSGDVKALENQKLTMFAGQVSKFTEQSKQASGYFGQIYDHVFGITEKLTWINDKIQKFNEFYSAKEMGEGTKKLLAYGTAFIGVIGPALLLFGKIKAISFGRMAKDTAEVATNIGKIGAGMSTVWKFFKFGSALSMADVGFSWFVDGLKLAETIDYAKIVAGLGLIGAAGLVLKKSFGWVGVALEGLFLLYQASKLPVFDNFKKTIKEDVKYMGEELFKGMRENLLLPSPLPLQDTKNSNLNLPWSAPQNNVKVENNIYVQDGKVVKEETKVNNGNMIDTMLNVYKRDSFGFAYI